MKFQHKYHRTVRRAVISFFCISCLLMSKSFAQTQPDSLTIVKQRAAEKMKQQAADLFYGKKDSITQPSDTLAIDSLVH